MGDPVGMCARVRSRLPSFRALAYGAWRNELSRYQTVGLLFWVIAAGCLMRVIVNTTSCCIQGVVLLSPMVALYAFSGFYVLYVGEVPTLFFEFICAVTSIMIMLHDLMTAGELDIWWLLLLVIDGMYLIPVRRAFRYILTFCAFAYMTLSVLAKSIGWNVYRFWDPEEEYVHMQEAGGLGMSWGLSVFVVRMSVFFLNVFLVHGVAASQARMLNLVNAVGADLAVFDLDAAELRLLRHRGNQSDLKSLHLLCSNLRRYKPYLPPEVLVYDPDQGSILVTQTLAVAKLRFPAIRPDIKERILQTTFQHVNRRGGWVHSVDSSSALLVFGVERKSRSYFEGIWGAGGLYIEVRRDDKVICESGPESPAHARRQQRNKYTVRVLGARRSLEECAPLIELPTRHANGTAKSIDGFMPPPAEFPAARFYADLGGTVIWFGACSNPTAAPPVDGVVGSTGDSNQSATGPVITVSDGGGDSPVRDSAGAATNVLDDTIDASEPLLLDELNMSVSFARGRAVSQGAGSPAATQATTYTAGKTLEVFLQEADADGAGLSGGGSVGRQGSGVVFGRTGSSGPSGWRVLSKLYGVTNLACEAALAIHENVERELGIRAECAVALDECELSIHGDAERRTLTIQGSGIDRTQELFELLSSLPGLPPSDVGPSNALISRLANSFDKGTAPPHHHLGGDTGCADAPGSDAGSGDGGGDVEAPTTGADEHASLRPSLICNHRAAEFMAETHGVVEVHAGPPDDGPVFAFGDRDRASKLERQEMNLQSQLPKERMIDLADITPRDTWVKIGEGKTGAVYAARSTRLYRDIAVKELHPSATQLERVMFLNELLAMNTVRWDTICNFLGYAKGPHGTVYIVMEMCQRGPLTPLVYNPRLTDDERAALCADVGSAISSALAYIHSKKMVHMDVASRNILVTADGQYRLGDLGFLMDAGEKSKVICYPWAPPEAIAAFPDVRASYAYDVWSFGMLQYEILAGGPPFGSRPLLKDIKATLAKGKLPNPPRCVLRNVACEKLWREFIVPCLSFQPLSRPTMPQLASLFEKDFNAGDSSSNLLTYTHTQRMSTGGLSQGDKPRTPSYDTRAQSRATLLADSGHNPYASNDTYGCTEVYGTDFFGSPVNGGEDATTATLATPLLHDQFE